MKLSIVTTLFQSAPWIEEFWRRATETAAKLCDDFEILFVNDGSPDDSLSLALELYEKDPRVRVLDLSRNFGHHPAMLAGLLHTRGERVFLIDCDLEEDPGLLERFWREMDAHPSCDAVVGIQARRKGGVWERLSGSFFDKLFNAIARVKIPKNALNLRLMSRRFVDSLEGIDEQALFLEGIFAYMGFEQRLLEVEKGDKGSTTYTLTRRVALALDSITSFSSSPLKISFYMSFVVASLSFLYAFWLVFRVLALGQETPEGWASTMVSIWFLGGSILMAIGVLGVYASRIYQEVKSRPKAVVRRFYSR